jgi:hypothetical protein
MGIALGVDPYWRFLIIALVSALVIGIVFVVFIRQTPTF